MRSTRSKTEEEIEEDALRFRRSIGIGDDQVWIDALTLVFKLQSHFGIGYLRVPDDQLPDPGGRWDSEKRLLIFTESVFAGANDPNPNARCRFTTAHEVAHAVFDDHGIRNRSTKDSLEKRTSISIRAIESRTDRFAVSVLAPLRLIELNESAESIARRFGLSKEAARAYRKRHGIKRAIPSEVQAIIKELKRVPTKR